MHVNVVFECLAASMFYLYLFTRAHLHNNADCWISQMPFGMYVGCRTQVTEDPSGTESIEGYHLTELKEEGGYSLRVALVFHSEITLGWNSL